MYKTMITVAAVGLVLAAVWGCTGAAQEAAWTEVVPGISYRDSVVGDGDPVGADSFVLVHYTGWLWVEGEKTLKFDSSRDRGEPIGVALGRNSVIQGWEKGIPGMKIGSHRTLLIESEYGYGERGSPPAIPPGATLIFDVEVVDLPRVDVEILEQGDGPIAEVGDQISVHYTGWVWENDAKGREFDSSVTRGVPYRFTLGARMVIPGWDVGLTGMKVGTKARLIIPPVMAYGRQGRPPTIPPSATLCFDVELMEIQGK